MLNLTKPVALVAMVAGLAAGSYGVASAASGAATTTTTTSRAPAAPPGASAQNPWGNQRSDETPLTGDALASVKAAALAKLGSDATVVRIETDADGHATYEAHMLEADGTPVTVYVDTSFAVVSVESR
ncbi:MAG: hypothetical protein ACJ76I_04050 [Gaiellaceae bacterium]